MSDPNLNQQLLSQDIHVSRELHSLSDKFAAFPEKDLDRERFLDFSRHLDYTECLLLEALPLMEQVQPEADDPDFYGILKAKDNLSKNYDEFNRLRNTFLSRYVRKERSKDREAEFERVMSFEQIPDHRSEEKPLFDAPSSDELTEEELEALEMEQLLAQQEAELAALEEAEEKAEKNRKEKKRQNKFTAEGRAQDEENARLEQIRQEGRRQEAQRLGIHVGDGQQLSDSQLRNETIRLEAQREALARQLEERKRLENETFDEYKRRMERSDTYPRSAQYNHNDFSAFGGNPTRNADPGYESSPVAGAADQSRGFIPVSGNQPSPVRQSGTEKTEAHTEQYQQESGSYEYKNNYGAAPAGSPDTPSPSPAPSQGSSDSGYASTQPSRPGQPDQASGGDHSAPYGYEQGSGGQQGWQAPNVPPSAPNPVKDDHGTSTDVPQPTLQTDPSPYAYETEKRVDTQETGHTPQPSVNYKSPYDFEPVKPDERPAPAPGHQTTGGPAPESKGYGDAPPGYAGYEPLPFAKQETQGTSPDSAFKTPQTGWTPDPVPQSHSGDTVRPDQRPDPARGTQSNGRPAPEAKANGDATPKSNPAGYDPLLFAKQETQGASARPAAQDIQRPGHAPVTASPTGNNGSRPEQNSGTQPSPEHPNLSKQPEYTRGQNVQSNENVQFGPQNLIRSGNKKDGNINLAFHPLSPDTGPVDTAPFGPANHIDPNSSSRYGSFMSNVCVPTPSGMRHISTTMPSASLLIPNAAIPAAFLSNSNAVLSAGMNSPAGPHPISGPIRLGTHPSGPVVPLGPGDNPKGTVGSHQNLFNSHFTVRGPITNQALYTAAALSSDAKSTAKTAVSPAVEQQMVMNLIAVRAKYANASTKEEKVSIAREYKQERNALMNLRKDVRSGRFQLVPDTPNIPVPSAPKKGTGTGPDKVYCFPTPNGVISRSYTHNGNAPKKDNIVINHKLNEHVIREEKRFTAQNPMRVSPAYDKAMQTRYDNAKATMDKIARNSANVPGMRLPGSVEKEFRDASEALLGYNRAKSKGTVVVDEKAQRHTPDFSAWQQRQRAAESNFNLGAVFGSTAHGRTQNPNRIDKVDVEEINASLLNSQSLLKRESMKKAYANKWGYKIESYTGAALSRMRHKGVQAISSGNESGSETVRFTDNTYYYTSTTARLVYCLLTANDIPKNALADNMSKLERKLFGNLAGRADSELLKLVQAGGKEGSLAQKLLDFRAENKHAIAQGTKLSGMLNGKSLNEKIEILENELNRLDKVHYKKLRKSFSADGMQKSLDRGAKKLGKRFDREVYFQTKGVDLSTWTPKSIDAEILRLQKQGANISSQLKLLYAKGTSASALERKTISNLLQQHKENSIQLRKLIGFRNENAVFKAKRSVTSTTYQGALRRKEYLRSGGYMIQSFMLRPLQQSDLAGVNGLAKIASLSTNHYVHILVKNSLKISYKSASWVGRTGYRAGSLAARKTGVDRAAHAVITKVNNTAPVQTIQTGSRVIRSQVNRAGRGVRSAQRAIVNATPQRVRTAVNSTKALNLGMKTRFDSVKTGIYNAVFRAKTWVAGTRVGQGISAVNRGVKVLSDGVKLVAGAAKTVLIKAILILFAVLVVLSLIGGSISMLSSVAGSVIASPDTKDEKIDLSKYYAYLQELETDFYDELKEEGESYDDYRIDVTNGGRENTKEILSMMAVYLEQNLDIKKNPNVKIYLESLFEDSHVVTKEVEKYKCSGCKTKTVYGDHDSNCEEGCTSRHETIKEYCPGHKRAIFTVTILGFNEIFSADTMGNAGLTGTKGDRIGYFKITHYCACTECCGPNASGETASGTKVAEGRTIAVDPDVIPLGTHVIINGHEYIAEDTGSAIIGNVIDIYIADHDEAGEKGTLNGVPVYHVSYEGDGKQDSGKWNGWVEENIEWCMTIYNMDWGELYTGIPNVTDIVGNETDLSGVEFVDGDRPGYQAIVNKALSQLGISGGQPYWSWYPFDSRVEWCATFVSWCANETDVLGSSIPKFASCSLQGVPWFKQQGQWAKPKDITPVAGDVIFFDWEQDGRPDHVGFVVGSDGSKVYTVEGNSRDMVRSKSYALNSNLIYGYGIPNYP